MYDWANSVYSLTITTAVFPIYYSAVAGDTVSVFGFSKPAGIIYTYSLSLAFLVIAYLSPMLSGIADHGGQKKSFMKLFAVTGSFSCVLLYFFTGSENVLWGLGFFMLATIGYAGSIVFYNAYLPEIATPDRFDRISAKGFSLGYIGSVILLIINLAMVERPTWFGIPDIPGEAARISFITVGVWWIGFAFYTFTILPGNPYGKKTQGWQMLEGFKELGKVFRQLRELEGVKAFLAAFFFYSMGFQTIMYLATIFGTVVLKLPQGSLIMTVLVIQLIAVPGAYLFTWSSSKIGNIRTLGIGVIICIGVCIAAYFVTTEAQFYSLAAVVGLVMGGIQSLSRATYSKLLPETTDHASYFSFYEFCEKNGIVLGTATYAIVTDATGDMRNTTLALVIFFVIGLFFLARILQTAKGGRIK